MSVDVSAMRVNWDVSGAFSGSPVVGGGVVYGMSGTAVSARNESDGALLWNWTPPAGATPTRTMVLTGNLLFVSAASSAYGAPGMTYAVDLASHLTVWSYPMSGDLALSSQGILYIVQGAKVVAITVK